MIITENMVDEAYWAYGADKAVRAALEAALAAIPLDAVTRDLCKEAVWALYSTPQVHPDDDARDGWQQGCEAAVAAIGALPVVPPRPTPTREAVARAMCCPSGVCGFPGNPKLCNRHCFDTDGLSAVLALFEQDTP